MKKSNIFPLLRWLALAMVISISLFAGCSREDTSDVQENSRISFEQASQIVIDEILDHELLDKNLVIVFAWPKLLRTGDELYAYEFPGTEPFPPRMQIEEESWFFWIDEAAGAQFTHPSKFVLINSIGGEYTVSEQAWWPVLNGKSLWVEEADYWNASQWIFSNVEGLPENGSIKKSKSYSGVSGSLFRQNDQPTNVALVVNGWRAGESGQTGFDDDAQIAELEFRSSGFSTSYMGPSGTIWPALRAVREGESTPEERDEWFTEKATELGAGDTLVIYINGHGINLDGEGIIGNVLETELKRQLEKFDPEVHVVVVLQSCQSGSFADGLKDVADLTITSTDGNTPSYFDVDSAMDGLDENPSDRGSEYSSGFFEDWKELQSSPEGKARVEARAELEGLNFWEALAAESHFSAREKDLTYKLGWTHPIASWGTRAAGPDRRASNESVLDIFNSPSNEISGFAWIDVNGDGIFEPSTDEVKAGIDVSLEEADEHGQGRIIDLTETGADGTFRFVLSPEQIAAIWTDMLILQFDLLDYHQFTLIDVPPDDTLDSDVLVDMGFTTPFQLRIEQQDGTLLVTAADLQNFGAGYVKMGKSGTVSKQGYTITWWVRQDGDHVVVTYSAIYDRNGTSPSGTPFATTAVGNPGLDPLGGHASGEFSDGEAHVRTPIMHPAGTEIDIWISFQGLDEAIKLTSIIVTP